MGVDLHLGRMVQSLIGGGFIRSEVATVAGIGIHKGVVYYLRDGRVRGVLLCNVWE